MKVLALDIGGTYIKYVVFHAYNPLEEGKRKSQASLGKDYLVKNVDIIIKEIMGKYDLEGIAISTAGVVDIEKGEIIHAADTIPDYKGFNWKTYIKENYNLHCQIENDVNCAALSEYESGAVEGEDMILCLAIGTGIGGAFIKDGQIYHGASNLACEVGYLNIDGQEFQKIASTNSLINKYKELSKKEKVDGKLIFNLAKSGDVLAIEAINYMIDNLSKGITNISYILNPKVLLLGGGVMEQEDYLRDRIEDKLDEYMIPIARKAMRVEFAQNGNLAASYGALYHYYKKRGRL